MFAHEGNAVEEEAIPVVFQPRMDKEVADKLHVVHGIEGGLVVKVGFVAWMGFQEQIGQWRIAEYLAALNLVFQPADGADEKPVFDAQAHFVVVVL